VFPSQTATTPCPTTPSLAFPSLTSTLTFILHTREVVYGNWSAQGSGRTLDAKSKNYD